MTPLNFDTLASPTKWVRQHFASARGQKANGAVLRLLLICRVQWCANTLQVAWRRIDTETQVTHMARNQGLLGEFTAAYHAIDVIANEIDHAIADTHFYLKIWVACVKCGKCRSQKHPRQWAGYIYAQTPAGGRGSAR